MTELYIAIWAFLILSEIKATNGNLPGAAMNLAFAIVALIVYVILKF